MVRSFGSLYATYLAAAQAYAVRVQPLCFVQDGLVGFAGRAEPLEGPLRAFEVVGLLATLGLNHSFLAASTDRAGDAEVSGAAAQALAGLVDHNPSTRTPLYDGHVVDAALGLFLFAATDRVQDAAEWVLDMAHRLVAGYSVGRYFPVSTDRYEDLLDLERGRRTKEELMGLSTLIPTLAEWLAHLGLDDEYADFATAMAEVFGETDFQLWFPDEDTDDVLYREYAAAETGATFSSIVLPGTADEMRTRMGTLATQHDAYERLSCVAHGFPALGLVASRHFRTPVAPGYWQRTHTPRGASGGGTDPGD